MEESVSGFKVTGSWDEIVEHGERITEALEGAVHQMVQRHARN